MNSFLTTTVDNHLLLKKSAIRPLANTAIANATYGIPENMPFWIRSYERVYLWTLNKLISDWSHTSIMAINCQLICFIHLSVCPYLFVHPSIRPSVHPSVHTSIQPSIIPHYKHSSVYYFSLFRKKVPKHLWNMTVYM